MLGQLLQKGMDVLSIIYKIDVLSALKEHGYNTTRLRREKLLSEGTIQSLREGKGITFQNISKLCEFLNCQPGDIIEYKPDDNSSTN